MESTSAQSLNSLQNERVSVFDVLANMVPTDVVYRNVWQLLGRSDRDSLRAVCKAASQLCVLLQNESTSVAYIHTMHGEEGAAEDVTVEDIRHIMPLKHADVAFLGNIRHLQTLRLHVGCHLQFGEAPYDEDVQGIVAAHVAAVLAVASAVDVPAVDSTVGAVVRTLNLSVCTAQELWCVSSQFTNLRSLHMMCGVYLRTCAPLGRCPTLRELHVECLHTDSYASIGMLTQLESLHLEEYCLPAEDAAETFRGWRHLTNLVDLKIVVGVIEHIEPCDVVAASELFVLTRLTSLCFMGVEYPTLMVLDVDDDDYAADVAMALGALANMSNLSTLILGEAFTADAYGLQAIARISGLTCLGVGHVSEQDAVGTVGRLPLLERLMVRNGLAPSEMQHTLVAFAPLANLVCVQLQACDVMWETDDSHVKLQVASAAERAALSVVTRLLSTAPKLQLAAIEIRAVPQVYATLSEATGAVMLALSARFPGLRVTLDSMPSIDE